MIFPAEKQHALLETEKGILEVVDTALPTATVYTILPLWQVVADKAWRYIDYHPLEPIVVL